jgi:hypothetical protein
MFMRVRIEELARSQIVFRFNEEDGGLSYEVRPIAPSPAGSLPLPSGTPSGASLNFQTIFDQDGRGRGLSVSACLGLEDAIESAAPSTSKFNTP